MASQSSTGPSSFLVAVLSLLSLCSVTFAGSFLNHTVPAPFGETLTYNTFVDTDYSASASGENLANLSVVNLQQRGKRILLGYLPAVAQWAQQPDHHEYRGQLNCFKTEFKGQVVSGAIQSAIDDINSDPTLLPDYHFELVYNNTCGDQHMGVNSLLGQILEDEVDAVIGPEVHCRTAALIAASQHLPMISYVRHHAQPFSCEYCYRD